MKEPLAKVASVGSESFLLSLDKSRFVDLDCPTSRLGGTCVMIGGTVRLEQTTSRTLQWLG